MLQYLNIENIAVIENANIEFEPGFNVLTGETGAGKSIIIDSLFAIMGERTSKELIRHGCDRAVVSACFTDIPHIAQQKLKELGYEPDENGQLVLQRVLSSDSRGQVRINSRPANVSTLKEIGRLLVNIHGQHDSQTLLNPESHMSFIDAFAENTTQKQNYSAAFENFRSITREYNAAVAAENEKKKQAELLEFQINEIEEADFHVGETEKLKQYLNAQQNSERICNDLRYVLGTFSSFEDSDTQSALDRLKVTAKRLDEVSATVIRAQKLAEAVNGIVLDLEGVQAETEKMLEENEYDKNGQEQAVQRLELISDIVKKYGGNEEAVFEFLSSSKQQLSKIQADSKRQKQLEELLEPAERDLVKAGAELTESRKKASIEICKKISGELKFLDFNGAVFKADIKQGRYTKNGCDTTEFLISANVGEEPKPLARIASGGELSRIMLAIRNVLFLKDDAATLIFDEIDTGISGHAAQKVGQKLCNVANSRQVICVTHLAQIAAAALNHFKIQKSVKNNKTYTSVTKLNNNDRIREIARIMSGGEYTENLLKTAEEMILLARKN